MKKRIVVSLVLAIVLTAVFSMAVYSETRSDAPVLSIEAKNVAFMDSVYMMFLVSHENAAASDVELLVWTDVPDDLQYAYGTQTYTLSYTDSQTYNGKDCARFIYSRLKAKELADNFYFRAYTKVDGTAYYSDVLKYSVVQYNEDIQNKSTNENLKNILTQMLEYGAAVQTYGGYHTDRLADSAFYSIAVVGGVLPDATTAGLYVGGESVVMTAPATDGSGIPFFGWKNSAGTIVSKNTVYTATVGSADETYTAYYQAEPEQYTVNAINATFANGSATTIVAEGTSLCLTAKDAPNGYRFSHWENAAGDTLGTSKTLTILASENTAYKAYYEPFFAGEIINGDLQGDWTQGGTNGQFTAFSTAYTQRVSFAEPYLLKAGYTIKVALPAIECPLGTCTGECKLTASQIILKKNATVTDNLNNLFTDYTKVSAAWKAGGFRYTAAEDVYVMVTVKYDKHGSEPFSVSLPCMQDVIVTVSKTSDANGIGVYWIDEVNDGIAKIEANREAIGGNVSEFFYMTDVHWTDNAQYSPALINYIAEKVNAYHVVFGGDVIRRYNPDKQAALDGEINGYYGAMERYTKVGEQLKIFTTLGNHDRNGSSNCPDPALRLTEQEAYDYYIKRMESWGVTTEGDSNHGYYDDAANKVRYIQFYFSGSQHGMTEDAYVDAAMTWAEEKIKELDSSWTVVLFTHGFFCASEGEANEITPKDSVVAKRLLRLQGEADAEIAVWITGHIHEDRNEVLYDADGNQLRLLSLNCDAYGNSNSATSYTMTPGTISEQSFSFVQVDTANRKIYLTRFGAGGDLTFTYGQGNMTGSLSFVDVTVVNGETTDDKSSLVLQSGDQITIIADPAPAGYAFSHWINSKGVKVGTTATLTLTVTASDVFKPVYKDTDPSNDTPAANQVLTDIANDWQQGSYNGKFTAWCYNGSTRHSRLSFAKPYLLKAGETMTVSLPTLEACPDGTCASTCSLICAYVVVSPTGSNTGNMDADYTVVSTKWGTTFRANSNCYVLPMIKYDKHGGIPLTLASSEMQEITVTVTSAS